MMLVLIAVFGAVVGSLTGLVGAGGGILAIPALVYVAGVPLETAITTSLVIGAVTPVTGLIPRIRDVDWVTVAIVALAGIPSAFLGTAVGALIPEGILLLAFAGLMVLAGLHMLRRPPAEHAVQKRTIWWVIRALVVGLVVGFITGLLGIGGGFITVPALTLVLGIQMRRAVAISLAVAMINSVAGIIAHLGTTSPDWAVTLAFGVPAAIASLVAARFAARVSNAVLRVAFAYLVLIVAAFTIVRAFLVLQG